MKPAKVIFRLLVPLIFSAFLLFPGGAWAFDDLAVVAAIHSLGHMLQSYMLQQLHRFSEEQTSKLTNKEDEIFKRKMHWEQWPASLRELFIEQSVKLENQGNQASYKNAQDYLSYAQGSASGIDATKYPARVEHYFNKEYTQVQKMNPACQLTVPQPIGDQDNKCSPAQQQFTNYLLTGVHPIPDYPQNSLNTSIGQAYVQAKKTNSARTALAQVALDQSTNSQTNQFIHDMEKNLQHPSLETINQESSAAVARDNLIIEKAKALISLKQYEVELMNQRLLATLVAQNEGAHLQRIRELSQHIN